MTPFKKNFIISLILVLIFFLNQPIQAIAESDGPRVKIKKTWQKGTPKKKLKRNSQKKKKKRAASTKKRKTISTRRSIAHVYPKEPILEEPIRPSVLTAGNSLQNLVENEILYLKEHKHLLSGDQISLQVFDLNDKKMLVDINGNVVRNAASLIKPFVMLAVYDSIARQELQETPEIEHQITRMIAVSDNEATNALIRRLGKGDVLQGIIGINALMLKMGFSSTRLRELIPEGGKTYFNQTSAADSTLFFRMLYDLKLINPQYSQKMNDILLKSIHDRIRTHRITQDGVAVADKTGYVRGLNGDCGIVYQKNLNGRNDYALSIIIENKSRPSDGGWGRKKSNAIRYLSDRIYEALKNNHLKG